ncbi:hypothetical protein [Bacillus cereus]|uniref:hypothetical protein n=1 Tax=Bacillus cereus TaxID=1396 RepID=UPI0038028BCC
MVVNWVSITSIIISIFSLIFAGWALYLNRQNTSINKEKLKNEIDEKKKANLIWEELPTNRNNTGRKVIKITNVGAATARNIQVFIGKIELGIAEEGAESEVNLVSFNQYKDPYPTPKNLNSSCFQEFIVKIHKFTEPNIEIKLIWDDDFEEKRSNTIFYIPGSTRRSG